MRTRKQQPITPLASQSQVQVPPDSTVDAPTAVGLGNDAFVAPSPQVADANNKAAIAGFYEAFANRDPDAMAALYHPDATFHDPAFGTLKGAEIGGMWRMLSEAAPDLKVQHSNVGAKDGNKASAHWDAQYTFGVTGNKVENHVDAKFEFKDGKIISHRDDFSFPKWAGQALGLDRFGWVGRKIAGWSVTQRVMQAFAKKGLRDFMDK